MLADAAGRLLLMNTAAEELLDITFAELTDAPQPASLLNVIAADGKPLPFREWPLTVVLRSAVPLRGVSLGVVRRDGAVRWLQVDAVPVLDAVGQLRGVAASFIDVTPRHQTEHDLRRLAAIVENSEDAILGFDLDGVVFSWNAGAERLYGVRAADAVDHSLRALLPAEQAGAVEEMLRRIAAGQSVRPVEADLPGSTGLPARLSVTVSPVRDATGRIVGASAIARDVTARRHAEAALAASEQRYRELFENAS
ncbi:MAG TPA: PAS domain S-box protein, partial [Dehalococcoidia bacterium]